MPAKGVLVVVSGPSGAGKSTLCNRIVDQMPGTMLSVSCTTRSPRTGEQDGVEYWFVEEAKFHNLIREGAFIEWAEVYGHRYGTPKQPLVEALDQGIDVLLDIDVQGARQIMERFDGAVYVFVSPPSLDVLRTRLQQRASDAQEEIQRRLQKASEEIARFKTYNYFIRNEDLQQATKELASIILAERVRTDRLDPERLVENGLVQDVTMKEIAT